MKRTSEDDEFAINFGAELSSAYDAAKESGKTDEEFADSIGVMRPQLKKYLSGAAVPCLRTVAMAKKNHNVDVPYAGVLVLQGTKKHITARRPVQLHLPLTIEATGADQLNVRVKSASSGRVELELMVRRAG